MKLRRINHILTDPKHLPCSKEELLEYANRLGYLLTEGGTPWDADTMAVRTLGPGKANTDFTAAFDPDDTFTVWQGPSRRNEWETAWNWLQAGIPAIGERAVHGTVSYRGRVATVEVECILNVGYIIYVDGAPIINRATEKIQAFDNYGDAVYEADQATTRLGQSLVATAVAA